MLSVCNDTCYYKATLIFFFFFKLDYKVHFVQSMFSKNITYN